MQQYVNVFIRNVYVPCLYVPQSHSIFDSDSGLVKHNSSVLPILQSFILNNFPFKLILLAPPSDILLVSYQPSSDVVDLEFHILQARSTTS